MCAYTCVHVCVRFMFVGGAVSCFGPSLQPQGQQEASAPALM